MSATANWGAVVLLNEKEDKDGVYYEVTQSNLQTPFPPAEDNGPRSSLDFGIGPIKFSLSVDVSKGEFGVTASIFGVGLGTFYASLTDGLRLNVNLLLAKGSINFYVKDGALWVRVDVDVSFDGKYHEDKKIIDL